MTEETKQPKSDKKQENLEEEVAIITREAYEEICNERGNMSKVLGEAFILIYKAGLLEEMSQQARDYLSKQPWLQEVIKDGDGPSLEPRLQVREYIQHMARIFQIPQAQLDFLTFIVKVCYLMLLIEKNPLVAQELRGVTSLSNAIESLTRV